MKGLKDNDPGQTSRQTDVKRFHRDNFWTRGPPAKQAPFLPATFLHNPLAW